MVESLKKRTHEQQQYHKEDPENEVVIERKKINILGPKQ